MSIFFSILATGRNERAYCFGLTAFLFFVMVLGCNPKQKPQLARSPTTLNINSPHVRESMKYGILDCKPWIQDSGFFGSGLWISDSNHYWDSKIVELYSGYQDPRFQIPQAKVSGFRILQGKLFQIPESGFPYLGELIFFLTTCMDCEAVCLIPK